jgi:hypothetical protein
MSLQFLRWLAVVGLLIAFSGVPQYAHLTESHDAHHSEDACSICQSLIILKTLVFVVTACLVVAWCPIFIVRLSKLFNLPFVPLHVLFARPPPMN